MTVYYVETSQGCGLKEARSIDGARAAANREVGSYNVRLVRKATPKDIDWVRGMGGYVPPTVEAR